MIIVIILSLVFFYIVWRCLFPTFKINGNSMTPRYRSGNIIVTVRCFSKKKLQLGCVYVYKDPRYEKKTRMLVKRLIRINEHGNYFFMGDNNKESYDSRHHGCISPSRVISKVLFKL